MTSTMVVTAWSQFSWLCHLGKGPLSVAMATGISIVMVVALATSLSASFGCCLA
jgi:hypothetical protein